VEYFQKLVAAERTSVRFGSDTVSILWIFFLTIVSPWKSVQRYSNYFIDLYSLGKQRRLSKPASSKQVFFAFCTIFD